MNFFPSRGCEITPFKCYWQMPSPCQQTVITTVHVRKRKNLQWTRKISWSEKNGPHWFPAFLRRYSRDLVVISEEKNAVLNDNRCITFVQFSRGLLEIRNNLPTFLISILTTICELLMVIRWSLHVLPFQVYTEVMMQFVLTFFYPEK